MKTIARIGRKEFAGFFSSPVAFIFMGAFLAVSLFIFFWVETFFATNIAEIRPLFVWMPILLIFLTSAVTMRMWAEERRAGTLEFLLTAPVSPVALVVGKFLGCLALVILSLLLTLPLPITVSVMGPLDWGPVLGGYIAAIFLAAAYIAIGLYISARSDNQIVSLILSCIVCAFFYLLGSDLVVNLFGTQGAEVLKLFGSGSRFESITRGVVDIRDLYYYLSIVGVFLSLNVFRLEKQRWAGNPSNTHHRGWKIAVWLLAANCIMANFWLLPLGQLRLDLTQGNIYSISQATRSYLVQLKEPLLIRGYFSAKTHPLLAPLVPRLEDLLQEYAVAGGTRVNVEFVDPLQHPELEKEAAQKYGIKPVPFQTASKYQSSVTNSYFDLLISYGDQFEVLGFQDLIEVKMKGDDDVAVELRNPEYDITRAIRKVLYSFQGGGALFSEIEHPVSFTGYFSQDERLPQPLSQLRAELQSLLDEMKQEGGDKFSYTFRDPDSGGGQLAGQLREQYGFQPMAASLFDQRTFWFYMVLKSGQSEVEIPLPQDFDKESLKRSFLAALKRFSTGFTKTIGLHTQPIVQPMPQYGVPGKGKHFSVLKDMLGQEHGVVEADLKQGMVPEQADLLILASPENLDDKQLFAVDQFLMQGGTVILATSPFDIQTNGQLSLAPFNSGLDDWLRFHGITIEHQLVLDGQNTPFPVPVQRDIGGFTVQETRLVDYPFFVDVRQDGMDSDSGLLSGISQITMNWPSPIVIDEEKNSQRTVLPLLESTEESWLTDDTDIQPDFSANGPAGFSHGEGSGRQVLGVMVEGRFTSYFKDKPSPLLAAENEEEAQANSPENGEEKEPRQVISRMIEKSPDTARIICFSSNSFLSDAILSLGSGVKRTGYLEPVQMVANLVDWSLEDRALLQIRGRSHFSRPLAPMSTDRQMFFEYLNYVLAILGLVVVWLVKLVVQKKAVMRNHMLIEGMAGRGK